MTSALHFILILAALSICYSAMVTPLNNHQAQIINVVSQQCNNHTIDLSHNGTATVSITRTNGNNPLLIHIRQEGTETYLGSTTTTLTTDTRVFYFLKKGNETSIVFSVGVCSNQVDTFDYLIHFQFYCAKSSFPKTSEGVECVSCPDNAARDNVFNNGNVPTEACQCLPGFKKSLGEGSLNCTTCPPGVKCLGYRNEVLDGYWPYIEPNTTETLYLKCPVAVACMHHQEYNNTPSEAYSDCSRGYGGMLCNNCQEGFYRLGERCYDCGNVALSGLLVFLWCVILLACSLVILPIGMVNTYIGSLSIVLTFIQTTSMFSRFDLKYPEGVFGFFYALSSFNLNIDIARFECFTPTTFFGKYMTMILLPIIFVSFTLLLTGCVFLLILVAKLNKRYFLDYLQWVANSYINFFSSLGYVFFLQWNLKFFACDFFGTSQMRLWEGSDIACTTDNVTYSILGIFALVGIAFFVILLPILIVLFGVTNFALTQKNPKNVMKHISPFFLKTFGSIYARFGKRYFYWEILIMARKLFLTICFAYLPRFPTIGAVMSSFVILVALVLQLRFNPYKHRSSNLLETILLLVQYFLLIFSLMIYSADASLFEIGYDLIISILLIVPVIIAILFGVAVFVFELIWYMGSSTKKGGEEVEQPEEQDQNEEDHANDQSGVPSHTELMNVDEIKAPVNNKVEDKGNVIYNNDHHDEEHHDTPAPVSYHPAEENYVN